ncbi:NAD(P)/FAD-dependent oxidoreductase [Sphingobium estronivorans]|uniref:NAD(P)/FAD-dependent oxidoreductase n=1 Tax=Sphingobium estronivorans TaxID=1577690 RepID=UPI00123907A2|nr:FAD-dependent oxidoreductase [Sphingobium estronivorans]
MNASLQGLSEGRNLRTGSVPWDETDRSARIADPFPRRSVDIAILGCGIMGSIIAERLSARTGNIAMFDRRPPGCGSTAASTAEIMWAMDVPMLHLARRLGEAEAARRWRRVFHAVCALADHIDALGIDGGKVERPTLYLAGNVLDERGLAEEADMHRRHGLPSRFFNAADVSARFGIRGRAALVSDRGFEVDPVHLSHALLDRAASRGATISFPVDIVALHPDEDGVRLEAQDGQTLVAREVILATGYERPLLFLPPAFSLMSTFAMATPPGTAPIWKENAMIWEASDPYLYVRTNGEGRIIAGGEDVAEVREDARDAMIAAKAGTIAAKLEAMLGAGPLSIDRKWAATFGVSPDGLPAIGRSSLMPHVWLAAGYGGNGIAFAALAAELLEGALFDAPDPDAICFDPYRFD